MRQDAWAAGLAHSSPLCSGDAAGGIAETGPEKSPRETMLCSSDYSDFGFEPYSPWGQFSWQRSSTPRLLLCNRPRNFTERSHTRLLKL